MVYFSAKFSPIILCGGQNLILFHTPIPLDSNRKYRRKKRLSCRMCSAENHLSHATVTPNILVCSQNSSSASHFLHHANPEAKIPRTLQHSHQKMTSFSGVGVKAWVHMHGKFMGVNLYSGHCRGISCSTPTTFMQKINQEHQILTLPPPNPYTKNAN